MSTQQVQLINDKFYELDWILVWGNSYQVRSQLINNNNNLV